MKLAKTIEELLDGWSLGLRNGKIRTGRNSVTSTVSTLTKSPNQEVIMAETSLPKSTIVIKKCSVAGCENRHEARQMCAKHYARWRSHGDPETCLTSPVSASTFWDRVDIRGENECWEWKTSRTRQQYGQVYFNRRVHHAHRLAYYFTHNKWPNPCCLHSCDNPPCCNPRHLRAGTKQENNTDKVIRHRQPQGSQIKTAKMNDDLVRSLRADYASGASLTQLAKQTGMHHSAIRLAVYGVTWRHVK